MFKVKKIQISKKNQSLIFLKNRRNENRKEQKKAEKTEN
jgi:hypothetical protein